MRHGLDGWVLVEYENLGQGEKLVYERGAVRTARRIIPNAALPPNKQTDPNTRETVRR